MSDPHDPVGPHPDWHEKYRSDSPVSDADWSQADDDFVRRALLSLRADVDNLALPDPTVVTVLGSRRRQRNWWIAGGTAAAVIAGVVALSAVVQDTQTRVATPATTTSTHATGTASARVLSGYADRALPQAGRFLEPDDFRSATLTGGASTESTAVDVAGEFIPCDAEPASVVGAMGVANAETGRAFARQRVQEGSETSVLFAELEESLADCPGAKAGDFQDMWQVPRSASEADGTTYVALGHLASGGITTLVLDVNPTNYRVFPTDAQAFQELRRLRDRAVRR